MSPQSPRALHELSAPALFDLYRRREVSPVEVTQSVLGHIERWEHKLCALYLLRPELALEQARASEARWLKGEPLGPVDGVPVTIKDNIATRGDPPATADAPPAARGRGAGGGGGAGAAGPGGGGRAAGRAGGRPRARGPGD